ncbi:phage tail assembly chaperone [Paracoccus bogoriensis]|uniref:phage tail assembly chaperone n=1 Tax=Paracoccus bogoriensis TaxID=242065 RepID=UPI001CA50AA8|nr:phage tail assembly chaperone [Paracoccus bogoriensis]MBW7056971.1 phage tail assembly chaperone [Paracoccus bogoriensis]
MPGIAPAPEVPLHHGPHAVTLRASLRAAVALDAMPGGFAAVWDGLAGQKLTTLHAVIRAAATDRAEAERLIAHTATHPLAQFALCAQAACLALIAAYLPVDQGKAPLSSAPARPIRDHLADLYRFGTGWLGWPPSEVWNASPAELEAAVLAHVDRLVMMTPDAEAPEDAAARNAQRQANIAVGLDPEFERDALRALKAKHCA